MKSLVVLTDGIENRARTIAQVAGQINEFTYSVGFGKPQNISVPALQNISGNNGGYMLVTGAIGTTTVSSCRSISYRFSPASAMRRSFSIPRVMLVGQHVERVPFQLTAGDAGVDVILLTPNTKIVDFRLQTPSGRIIEPWRAMSEPGMRFVLSEGVSYYRLVLPTELLPDRFDGSGTWHALLTIGRPHVEPTRSPDGVDRSILRGIVAPPREARTHVAAPRPNDLRRTSMLRAEGFLEAISPERVAVFATSAAQQQQSAPYSLVVHAYSNLSLEAELTQHSFEPGARFVIFASLAESGIPLQTEATVWADVRRPNGAIDIVNLDQSGQGQFKGHYDSTMPGVYRFRIRARGVTSRGEPFVRERTQTGAVWRSGDVPPDPNTNTGGEEVGVDPRDTNVCLCELLKCLLSPDGVIESQFEKRLRELGINLAHARKCVEQFCRCETHRR